MLERLDHGLLGELEILMEEGFPSLLEAYLRDSELRLFEATEGWEQGDYERVRRSAHSLKGSSSNIGAQALAGLCSDLEASAREQRGEAIVRALALVRAELGEVSDAVRALSAGIR